MRRIERHARPLRGQAREHADRKPCTVRHCQSDGSSWRYALRNMTSEAKRRAPQLGVGDSRIAVVERDFSTLRGSDTLETLEY
jgi:hypothetical protein